MATSVQFRSQNRDLGMAMRQVDEDLAVFLGMRNDRPVLAESHEFEQSKGLETKSDSFLAVKNASEEEIVPITADDHILDLQVERSDHNWLITQPDSSLLPTVEVKVQDSTMYRDDFPNGEAISVKSELENTCEDSASLSDSPLHQDSSSTSTNSSNKRPSITGPLKTTPRSATPTSRSTRPAKSKLAQPRSSTPTRTITPRNSIPSSRPIPPIASKPGPRPSTPTRKLDRSSSTGTKMGPTIKATSAVPNKKHVSKSDEKHGQQKPGSPPKARAPNISGGHKTGSKMLFRSRRCGDDEEEVNPVLMGTKMVERVVSMRKLAPPKRDEYVSHDNPKRLSHENSGFGRSLSKKSLDMAIRHMDIRRSISDKLCPE